MRLIESGRQCACDTRQSDGADADLSCGAQGIWPYTDGVPDHKVSVREEIARYRERLGVDHFIVRCQWPGLPQAQVLNSIQRLGEIFAS
jgi:hypothetical protein